jgi:hypothetical protein
MKFLQLLLTNLVRVTFLPFFLLKNHLSKKMAGGKNYRKRIARFIDYSVGLLHTAEGTFNVCDDASTGLVKPPS